MSTLPSIDLSALENEFISPRNAFSKYPWLTKRPLNWSSKDINNFASSLLPSRMNKSAREVEVNEGWLMSLEDWVCRRTNSEVANITGELKDFLPGNLA